MKHDEVHSRGPFHCRKLSALSWHFQRWYPSTYSWCPFYLFVAPATQTSWNCHCNSPSRPSASRVSLDEEHVFILLTNGFRKSLIYQASSSLLANDSWRQIEVFYQYIEVFFESARLFQTVSWWLPGWVCLTKHETPHKTSVTITFVHRLKQFLFTFMRARLAVPPSFQSLSSFSLLWGYQIPTNHMRDK